LKKLKERLKSTEMKVKIYVLVILLCPFFLFGQDLDEEINIAGFRFLDYNSQLPEDFLSTKTAVFVSVPPDSRNTSERGDWKVFSETAHMQIEKMGIDAVAYYFMDDLKSGNDPALYFANELKKRDVKNIILLSRVPLKIKGNVTERTVLVITPFNGENSFISNGQKAWKTQAKDLDKVLKTLGREVYKDKQLKTNFMVLDHPEFFTDADIISRRRFPVYASDLKVDKLAIPKSALVAIPESRPGGAINKSVEKEITEYNKQVVLNQNKMERIMKSYPLKYGFTENLTEKELYQQEYQYILLRLNTTGVNIKQMLDFEINPNETNYITVENKNGGITMRNIPVNAPVYKYYVKHLYTKDVYVGTKWDADESWEDALANFITNMKEELKVK
jgi:hypothetical protein